MAFKCFLKSHITAKQKQKQKFFNNQFVIKTSFGSNSNNRAFLIKSAVGRQYLSCSLPLCEGLSVQPLQCQHKTKKKGMSIVVNCIINHSICRHCYFIHSPHATRSETNHNIAQGLNMEVETQRKPVLSKL